jgi:hypothetical protein
LQHIFWLRAARLLICKHVCVCVCVCVCSTVGVNFGMHVCNLYIFLSCYIWCKGLVQIEQVQQTTNLRATRL